VLAVDHRNIQATRSLAELLDRSVFRSPAQAVRN